MATSFSPYSSTLETTNHNRASRVLLGPCTDQFRELLQHYVPAARLTSFIGHGSHLPKLTPPQSKIIFQRPGNPRHNYNDMDISLLYILLRNLCNIPAPIKGWGKPPDNTDNSLSACIERIRVVRNELGHSTSTCLSQTDFSHLWSKILEAVNEMDKFLGTKYRDQVDLLLNETMDPVQEKVFTERLRKQVEEEEKTREMVEGVKKTVDSLILSDEKQKGDIQLLQTKQEESQKQQKLTTDTLQDHSKQITSLHDKHDATQKHMGVHGDKIASLQAQQNITTKNVQAQSEKIISLKSKQDATQNQHNELNKDIASCGKKIATLQAQLQKSEQQKDVTSEKVEVHDRRIASLEGQNEVTYRQHGILTRNIEVHTDEIASMQIQLQESQRQQDILTDNVEQQATSARNRDVDIERLGQEMNDLRGDIQSQNVNEDEKNRLKGKLIALHGLESREIPLSPLQVSSDTLPLEQLYSAVTIRENVKETWKGKRSEKEVERKEVKSPRDLLTKNGEPVSNVFMLGKAGHGKTTFCHWILNHWCNCQNPDQTEEHLNEWENAMSQFDFVFHLPLRYVDPSRANVTDMICQDIFGRDSDLGVVAKHVLSNAEYRCFIMIDGLDEWKPDDSAMKQLKHEGMPNVDNMSNCVIFTTMRPSVFLTVARVVRDHDQVIEIHGLDDKGIENVIKKVLVHYYELKVGTVEYETKHLQILSKLKDKTLKSFIRIPLLAVVCVQMWYEGNEEEGSMTSFYTDMLNMLLERALSKRKIGKLPVDSVNIPLPSLLTARQIVKEHMSLLLRLGKVAYEGLVSNEMKLVFQREALEKKIGGKELQFALDVGLISQKEARSIITRKVSVDFLHKSVQEFLAVLYIGTQKGIIDSFCGHLNSIKVIMEYSNIIAFVCGMYPSLGTKISGQVVDVVDNDTDFINYRNSVGSDLLLQEMFELQISWFREFRHGQTLQPKTFHVSDVNLKEGSEAETVKMAWEILLDCKSYIRSLFLNSIPTSDEEGITNAGLNDFLSNRDMTRTLVKLFIDGKGTDRCVNPIRIPTLRTLQLHNVLLQEVESDPANCTLVMDMPLLQTVRLAKMKIDDRHLGLTACMTNLQNVSLDTVKMSPRWGEFINTLIAIQHQFEVVLWDTDLDMKSVETVKSSHHFQVTQDNRESIDEGFGNRHGFEDLGGFGGFGNRHGFGGLGNIKERHNTHVRGHCIGLHWQYKVFEFTRVWPLA